MTTPPPGPVPADPASAPPAAPHVPLIDRLAHVESLLAELIARHHQLAADVLRELGL